jgi:hypothetical protein
MRTGQEARETKTHRIGAWYVSEKGVVFTPLVPPSRIFGSEQHGGAVMLRSSGQITTLLWGPGTEPLPAWPIRAWRKLTGWKPLAERAAPTSKDQAES